jgi:hypothetical protein
MIRKIICINSVAVVLLAACFLICPPVRAALDIQDPALRQRGVPKAAWRLYPNLTPRVATRAGLMFGAVAVVWTGHALVGIVLVVVGVMLPVMKRKKPPTGVEDWPDTKPTAVASTSSPP